MTIRLKTYVSSRAQFQAYTNHKIKHFLCSLFNPTHYKKSLKFRGTKLLENRLFLLGMSLFSEELMSWKNSWLQSHYRGNFRGTFVSEEEYPRNIDLTTEPQTDTKVTKISEEVCPRNVFYFKK